MRFSDMMGSGEARSPNTPEDENGENAVSDVRLALPESIRAEATDTWDTARQIGRRASPNS